MKLSQLTTDESLDVLCAIAPRIQSICDDEEIAEEFRRKIAPENSLTKGGHALDGLKKIYTLTPMLLGRHRNDVYCILSAVNQKTPDEIAEQSLMETMSQIKELFEDEEFADFFRSFGQQVKSA